MANYSSFTGTIVRISNFGMTNSRQTGCTQMIEVSGNDGSVVNFIVSPATYIVDQTMLRRGNRITGFYNTNLPVPLIYPPQYRASVIVLANRYPNVMVAYFNSHLVNADGTLKLNISRNTIVTLANGMRYIGSPGNRNLAVIYSAATRSIPAQTVPERIIVLCD